MEIKSKAGGVYRIECIDKDGNVKWVAVFVNALNTIYTTRF